MARCPPPAPRRPRTRPACPPTVSAAASTPPRRNIHVSRRSVCCCSEKRLPAAAHAPSPGGTRRPGVGTPRSASDRAGGPHGCADRRAAHLRPLRAVERPRVVERRRRRSRRRVRRRTSRTACRPSRSLHRPRRARRTTAAAGAAGLRPGRAVEHPRVVEDAGLGRSRRTSRPAHRCRSYAGKNAPSRTARAVSAHLLHASPFQTHVSLGGAVPPPPPSIPFGPPPNSTGPSGPLASAPVERGPGPHAAGRRSRPSRTSRPIRWRPCTPTCRRTRRR